MWRFMPSCEENMTGSGMNDLYIGADSEDDFERQRINLLQELEDPGSIRRLNRIGVQRGWRCLEVGAGDGSLARWLADRVGRGGHVVATDIDLRFLESRERENLEVREHNILEDDLEHESYDLVHSRAVLMHLSRPSLALQRMVKALRPGGWLLVEETDYLSFKALEGAPGLKKRFDRTIMAMLDILFSRGVVNPYFGRRLSGLVRELNVAETGHMGTTRVVRGGEPAARYQKLNFSFLVRPHVKGRDGLGRDDFDFLKNTFDRPSFSFVDRMVFGVWGRAPV